MREILFRGKDAESGEWVEGYYVHFETMHEVFYAIYTGCADDYSGGLLAHCYDVKPETVGQYTGLKDVHGKRVFEADILSIKCADEKSRPYPVYFGTYNVESTYGDDFHIGFYTKFFGEDISLGFLADSNYPTDFEVIGNIFDNPELLEGDKT